MVAGASLGLEVAQYVLAVGSSDITDVVVNTAGGLAGIGLLALARRRLRATDRRGHDAASARSGPCSPARGRGRRRVAVALRGAGGRPVRVDALGPVPAAGASRRRWISVARPAGCAYREGVPTAPASWYPDPHQPARLRYWDGAAWTGYLVDPERARRRPVRAPAVGAGPPRAGSTCRCRWR